MYLVVTLLGTTSGIETVNQNEEINSNLTASRDNFTRNQKCLDQRAGIESRLKSETSGSNSRILEQIFYSPEFDACLYVGYVETGSGFFNRSLYDVRNDSFVSKPLEQCNSVHAYEIELRDFYLERDGNLNEWDKNLKACDSFNLKLEEYKI